MTHDFPGDRGPMGEAIRDYDWASTSIGPIDQWPVSLKAVVEMMLKQRHAICLFWGSDLNIIFNEAYGSLLGMKAEGALGQPFSKLWAEVWDDLKSFTDRALAGEGTFVEDFRLMMDRNGYLEETFWTFSYSPLYDDEGHIRGIINVTIETTPFVVARRKEEMLKRELIHRVKNTMAVTTAVVTATMRHADTLEEARETVRNRITALGEAQNLVYLSDRDVTICEIVRESMKAHLDHEGRAVMDGPSLWISSQQALGLSMAIYELATNALKYGALSNEQGTVTITWSVDDNDSFHLLWQERGGPPVSPPKRSGFGSRLTGRIVAAYFSGEGNTTYHPEGVTFELKGIYRRHDHG
ncbi:HWE histidine kinase domain-containing protein [Oryzifoliimicrobium ureilyticus]|uniref:HWE histidine kinase domain-containing protein n=1 Tax=Oryzifoliimicrobium ureilyticus TaxID=3113724 RepID=UPI0030765134